MSVGFVGVGAMGLPMARNILASTPVVIYDLDPVRVAELAEHGAAVAESAYQVAMAADVVIVMVATPDQLQQALFGDHGAAAGLRPGQSLIITSSIGVDAIHAVEDQLAGTGVLLMDAPVTGGVARAVTGELTVLAGGSPEALAAAEPALKLVSSTVAHCGPNVGDGQAVKLVNQLLCSVHLAAAAEALSFAAALGLDPGVVLRTIESGAASSFMLSDRGPRMLAATEPPVLSAIDIFVKDSSLVVEAATKAASPAPMAQAAAHQFAAAQSRGWGRRDDSTVIGLYTEQINHQSSDREREELTQ